MIISLKSSGTGKWSNAWTWSRSSHGSLISLDALLGIILAIMVLIPILLFMGNFFRVSDQAKDSFFSFKTSLDSISYSDNIEDRSRGLLLLDDETMVVYFDQPRLSIIASGGSSYGIILARPVDCTTDSCLCLYQKVEAPYVDGTVSVNPTKFYCFDLSYPVSYVAGADGCGVGSSVKDAAYQCQGGFIIDRGVLKGESGLTTFSSYFTTDRRVDFIFGPSENKGVRIAMLSEGLLR